ncbi:MAG: hypothetical protein ACYC6R_17865 [Anaerolineales bacterium]
MDNDNNLVDVNRKLDVLLKLLAYQTVGKMTLTEGAPLLRRLGFTPSEIAAIYGSTTNVVSVRLAEAKKKTKKG